MAELSTSTIYGDLTVTNNQYVKGQLTIEDGLTVNNSISCTDISISLPSTVYNLSHDSFTDFVSNEHINHTNVSILSGGILSGGGDITTDRTITLNHSDVDHDQTTNFVSNEHIDHSGVSITAGSGLSGGGDITTNRTLNVELDIEDSGTNVNTGHGLNFNSNLNVTDDGDGTFTIDVPNDLTVISNYDTDDLTEGTGNLYFTTGRVDSHLTGGTGINYSTGTISIDSTVVQTSDSDISGNTWVLDEDDFASNSAIKVATQQSIKTYVDNNSGGDSNIDLTLTKYHIESTDDFTVPDKYQYLVHDPIINGNITVESGGELISLGKETETFVVVDFDSEYDNGTAISDTTINWDNGNNQKIILNASITLTFSNMGVGHKQLRVIQDSTGGRSLTLPSGKWPGGTTGSFSTSANSEDTLSIFYNGTDYYYQIIKGWA